MRSQRQGAPTTSPGSAATVTPLAAAFRRIAAMASGSISAASAMAPARAQAIAAMPPAGGEVQHAPAGDDGGMVQDVPRQGLAARPGERPERRLDVALRQPVLGRLPDRGDLGGEVQGHFRHEWRGGRRGLDADKPRCSPGSRREAGC